MEKEIALVYMAAGMSSRFLGRIKSFAVVGENEETLIERSLKQALPAGFSKIIFIVSNKTEQSFRDKFRDNYKGIPVYYALQSYDENERDKPWGTTDALCSAKQYLDCPFVICNGDDLYGENSFKILFNHLVQSNDCATLGFNLYACLPDQGRVNRGIFQTEGNFVLGIKETFEIEKINIQEKNLDENTLCSMNIFALHPLVLEELSHSLKEFKKTNKGNRKIEALMPEDISSLVTKKKIKLQLYSTPDIWMGITNPGDEEIVKKKLASI